MQVLIILLTSVMESWFYEAQHNAYAGIFEKQQKGL